MGLTKLLKADHDLTPLAADRAVLWCDNELDRIKTEKLGCCFLPGVREVKLQRWNPQSQLNNSKIVCRNSWLGIEGLPLNMWNKHVFKVIGSKCGGLLDIARCTAELTCLTQVVIKIKKEVRRSFTGKVGNILLGEKSDNQVCAYCDGGFSLPWRSAVAGTKIQGLR